MEKEQTIFKKEASSEIEEKETAGEKERFESEKPLFEAAPEKPEEKEKPAAEKEIHREKLEKLREQFRELKEKIETEKQAERLPFKDFEPYFVSHNRIELPEEKEKELEQEIQNLQTKDTFKGPRIFSGNKTATEYDSRAANFSTQTAIVELSSGEKVFVVDSYPASLLHRLGDSVCRRLSGHKAFKAPNSVWKEVFEKRSNIPTIKIKQKYAVAMPYIENVNVKDLMAHNKEIKNWGPVEWAKNVDLNEKKEIIKKAAGEIEKIHRQNKTWGETHLGQMIIDKNKKVWVCDPEMLFYKEVPLIEQRASDLKDVILSSAAALEYSEKFKDYGEITKLVFDNYSDKSVIETAKQIAARKLGFGERFFFYFTKARFHPLKNLKMYEEIRQAIVKYGEKE